MGTYKEVETNGRGFVEHKKRKIWHRWCLQDETSDGYLYIFYDDKKAKIPLDKITYLSVN